MAELKELKRQVENLKAQKRRLVSAPIPEVVAEERGRIVELLRYWASKNGVGCTFATKQQEGMWQAANAIASGATKEAS